MRHVKFAALLLYGAASLCRAEDAQLELAREGTTAYSIICSEDASAIDKYAVTVMVDFLLKKTGVAFPVITPEKASPDTRGIFIGYETIVQNAAASVPDGIISTIRRKLFPRSWKRARARDAASLALELLEDLQEQEYVCRSAGDSIYIYGKGLHGNFHAVLDFMEVELGRRWYADADGPLFTQEPHLTLEPFNRKDGFAFTYRGVPNCSVFNYQQRMNMGFSEAAERTKNAPWFKEKTVRDGEAEAQAWYDAHYPAGMHSQTPYLTSGDSHSLLKFIPPFPVSEGKTDYVGYEWLGTKGYFEKHPEYFTMNKAGERVSNRQLCFSNPELRAELTRNVLKRATLLREGEIMIPLGQTDLCGPFCECPGCKALEEVYSCPGGPFYDYLLELCPVLAERHPGVMIKMLAYWVAMTRKPPVLPPDKEFPQNIWVTFCTVEEAIQYDWLHPVNASRGLYDDLLSWRKLTPHISVWCYPRPFGAGGACYLPFGNLRRMIADVPLMHKAGVKGVFFEFCIWPRIARDGFAELQEYVFYKLSQYPDTDAEKLVRDFTDAKYGAAAELVRQYHRELEEAQQEMGIPMSMWPAYIDFYGQHSYLSQENLRRWQGYFDKMETTVVGDTENLDNVKNLRHSLDFATLTRWSDLKKFDADYFSDYHVHLSRLQPMRERHKHANTAVENIAEELLFQETLVPKPLSAPYDAIPQNLVHRFVPVNRSHPGGVPDTDAAFGRAAPITNPDMPFTFGFFMSDRKKPGKTRSLTLEDIIPDKYSLYPLGTIELTSSCLIWFSAQSWAPNLDAGVRLYEAGTDNRHDVIVSLKFEGPSYGGKTEEDRVLCDQVIFVKKTEALSE